VVRTQVEPLERRLDRSEHVRHRIAVELRQIVDVLADVAVLRRLLAAAARIDRRPEAIHLPAGVVEVVLLNHVVAGEAQQAGDRVAIGAVARRPHGERARRVRGDELDLDALRRARGVRGASTVVAPGGEDLGDRLGVPGTGKEEVDEAWARDLDALDSGERSGLLGDAGGHLAGIALLASRQLQRGIGGEVAMRRIAGARQLDIGSDRCGEVRCEALHARHARLRAVRTAPRAARARPSILLRP
jgi:hypothetical protein